MRGVDGQLYWPMLTNDFVHPSLHVYRMPAGVQVMQLDANGVEKLSPGRYLLWTTPRSVEPMHEGKVTYVELGSAPIEVPIPVQNNNVSHAGDGAIISYDSQATPRRAQDHREDQLLAFVESQSLSRWTNHSFGDA